MGFLRTLRTVWSKLEARSLSRRILASWFSGSATLKRIAPLSGPQAGFSLLYHNGRRIALDESGILNPPNPGAGRFEFGSGEWDGRYGEGGATDATDEKIARDSREFLDRFDRIVLDSLLRHIRRPSDDPRQRDFAAQAATLIWMASRNRLTAGSDPAGSEGFLGAGSARETAPLR
jgi:hypothetical protein